jgi:hypothetical protein
MVRITGVRLADPLRTDARRQPEAGQVGGEEGDNLSDASVQQREDVEAAGNIVVTLNSFSSQDCCPCSQIPSGSTQAPPPGQVALAFPPPRPAPPGKPPGSCTGPGDGGPGRPARSITW